MSETGESKLRSYLERATSALKQTKQRLEELEAKQREPQTEPERDAESVDGVRPDVPLDGDPAEAQEEEEEGSERLGGEAVCERVLHPLTSGVVAAPAFGVRALGLVVACPSGIKGAPFHSALVNSASKL